MKVTPVAAPIAPTPAAPATDARARAINAFMKGPQAAAAPAVTAAPAQPNDYPVPNANNVAPEDISAIAASAKMNMDSAKATPEMASELESAPAEQEAAATDEAPVVPKVDPEVEKRFTELARQERMLRQKAQKQAQELKAQQTALDAQKAALEERAKQIESGYIPKERFKIDPLAALTEAGLSYDELTQRLLNPAPNNPAVDAQIKALQDELRSFKSQAETTAKAQTDRQQADYKAALKQIERDTTALIKADTEAYEAISKTNSIRDVVDLIERTYQKDGILLTVEEAAQEVENYLVEESYKTVSKIDKIKKRLAENSAGSMAAKSQPSTETQASPTEQKTETQPTMKTLTNAASSTRQLSARERAILAFKGDLKR